jgi:hypothetical protein
MLCPLKWLWELICLKLSEHPLEKSSKILLNRVSYLTRNRPRQHAAAAAVAGNNNVPALYVARNRNRTNISIESQWKLKMGRDYGFLCFNIIMTFISGGRVQLILRLRYMPSLLMNYVKNSSLFVRTLTIIRSLSCTSPLFSNRVSRSVRRVFR